MSRVKKIGLIGGLGPASTQMYYQKLTSIILKKTGVYPHILINSVPMNELNAFFEAERFEEATDYLLQQILVLQHSGAELIAVASNTPHILINNLKQAIVGTELISIVDVAVEAVKSKSVSRVGILGTRFTMQGGFYQKVFAKQGILACIPRSGHFKYINTKIFEELAKGIVLDETFEKFYRIVLELIDDDKIETLLMACTELSLLFKNPIPGISIIDTAKEHIEYISKKAIEH